MRLKVIAGFMLALFLMIIFVNGATAKPAQPRSDQGPDWGPVEQAMGRAGTLMQGDVMKFSMPRSDLKVSVGNVTIAPALALGSWVAFKKAGNGTMAMGDLVLTESEVKPVMDRLEQGGIDVTAVHNHLMGESPRVIYMHIGGQGSGVAMADTIHAALSLTGTPPSVKARAAQDNTGLDTARLDSTLKFGGKWSGNVYQFSVPRAEKITDKGMEIPPSMGVAMPINFQPTGNGKAAIAGDLVLTAGEVNPVIRALRDNGIEVTALHSHMLTEEPRLFFMHFWANDDANKLATGMKAALDRVNVKPEMA